MTFSRSWRSEKEDILIAFNEATSGEFKGEFFVDLFCEAEVKGIEGSVWVTKASKLNSASEEPIGARLHFVVDEGREKVDGGHGSGLRLYDSGFERVCHSA